MKALYHLDMKALGHQSRHGFGMKDLRQALTVWMADRGRERSVYEEMFFDSLG